MRPYFTLTVVCLLQLAAAAGATDVSGDQSGTWTPAQSPYYLVGDVRVPPGETLTIEPAVQVISRGYWRITVDSGATLRAVGTPQRIILFTADNHETGWRGLRIFGASDATTLRFCIVEYAKSSAGYPEVRGGGIFVRNCSATITDCELRFNSSSNSNRNGAGGGILTETSNALIADNYIHDNYADSGGGICVTEYGTPHVLRNVVVDNDASYAGGGMYFGARSSPLVENNIILRNWAGGWGGGGINSWTAYVYYNTQPTIRNNIIARNVTSAGGDASGGGGVYCRYDKAVLYGNVIAYNQGGLGGGLYVINYPAQAVEVSHSIIWGNQANDGAGVFLYAGSGSVANISYSDVQGGWSGTGNIDQDPLFADPNNDDFHLTGGSPCVDAGDPGYQPAAGERDLDNQRRVWNGKTTAVVDMGADEYGSYRFGDMNCDGLLDFGDINPFVLALSDPQAYRSAYPHCDYLNGDIDEDGRVTFGDINPFVGRLGR